MNRSSLYSSDTPPGLPVRATHRSPSPLPIGFKAQRFRRSLDSIRDGTYRRSSSQDLERGCSAVDLTLFDENDSGDRILAGVARLVFRHIAESERDGTGPSMCAAECAAMRLGKPTTADFDRDHFFEASARRVRLQSCCLLSFFTTKRRKEEKIVDNIFRLLDRMFALLECPLELGVLTAIYIENLIESKSVRMTSDNWLSIVVVALLISSKVWEDISPWNSDFAKILTEAVGLRLKTMTSLYILESKFMKVLDWKVGVSAETYASYYWSLCEADLPATPRRSSFVRRAASASFMQSSYGTENQGTVVMTFTGLSSSGVMSQDGHPGYASGDGGVRSPSILSQNSSEKYAFVSENSTFTETREMWAPHNHERILAARVRPFLEDMAHAPEGKPQAVLQDRWMLDRHNPHVGLFRHAQQAAPPSRHLNERQPRLQISSSMGTNPNLANKLVQDPQLSQDPWSQAGKPVVARQKPRPDSFARQTTC